MARICALFSGSSGNATVIKDGEVSLLVDAGVSFKRLKNAAEKAGVPLNEIGAVFITHTHNDHIAGLNVLLKNYDIPVAASADVLKTLTDGNLIPAGAKTVLLENTAEISGAGVTRFDTSHDSAGSGGYSFLLPSGKKISVCTDLGVVTDSVRAAISGSDAVLIESNHDVDMLKRGPYPPPLKLRILSDSGHLSNVACATELPALLKSGTTRFILGHLSLHNNMPALALSTAKASLFEIGAKKDEDYILTVAAPQDNKVTAL